MDIFIDILGPRPVSLEGTVIPIRPQTLILPRYRLSVKPPEKLR